LAHLGECSVVADRLGGGPVRSQLWWFQAATASVLGDYERAERLGREASEQYRRTRRHDADLIELALLLGIAVDRGGVEEVLSGMTEASQLSPRYQRFTDEMTAWALAEVGALDLAAELIGRVGSTQSLPDDYTGLCGSTAALHVHTALGDVERTRTLMEWLEPYRGRFCNSGSGGCSAGLVDLALALGAALLGESRARDLFADAVAGHERMGALAWLARSLAHQGTFLIGTGDAADAAAGRAALERAGELARRYGFPYVDRRVRAALNGS
jgi:hypothetical protein